MFLRWNLSPAQASVDDDLRAADLGKEGADSRARRSELLSTGRAVEDGGQRGFDGTGIFERPRREGLTA